MDWPKHPCGVFLSFWPTPYLVNVIHRWLKSTFVDFCWPATKSTWLLCLITNFLFFRATVFHRKKKKNHLNFLKLGGTWENLVRFFSLRNFSGFFPVTFWSLEQGWSFISYFYNHFIIFFIFTRPELYFDERRVKEKPHHLFQKRIINKTFKILKVLFDAEYLQSTISFACSSSSTLSIHQHDYCFLSS